MTFSAKCRNWALLLLLPTATFAQSKRPIASRQAAVGRQSVVTTDGASIMLSKANSSAALYNVLSISKTFQPKSQFETTEAYLKRSEILSSASISGDVRFDSKLVFIVDPDIIHGFTSDYDADQESLSVTTTAELIDIGSDSELLYRIPLSTLKRRTSSYVGSNAFGARVDVDKVEEITTGVLIRPGTELFSDKKPFRSSMPTVPEFAEVMFSMAADKAQKFVKHGRVVLVGHLESPFIQSSFSSRDPTISIALDKQTEKHDLYFAPEQILLVDSTTGVILARKAVPENPTANSMTTR